MNKLKIRHRASSTCWREVFIHPPKFLPKFCRMAEIGSFSYLSKGAKRLAATVPFFLPGFAQRRCPFWRWSFCVDLLQHLPVLCQKSIQRQGHKTAFGGGECSRFFFGHVAAPPCTLPNKSIQRQGHTTALRGGMLVIFFWTISAANPDRTMRSARPPLFVTLFDTLLGRFWRFLGSFWRPERGLGPTWGYLGISKVKVCTPSLHF